ncbi:helix-turn-helix domain-containing protein, partial [Nocardioides sp. NPDC000441]
VVPPHRDGGQAQFIRHHAPAPGDTGISAATAWALAHLDRPLSLEAMASRVSMSVRTFTRRFRDETGDSPGRWLQRQRIELARNLLETTDLSMEQVAARCGLNTAQSLRLHFHAALGVTPTAYRRTFRG